MKIGIVGAGHVGRAVAALATDGGHEVWIANSRGPESLAEVAAETGARAAAVREAADGAELVVLAIPLSKVPSLEPGLFDGRAEGAPIVDANNYLVRRDGRIEELWDGRFLTDSGWVAAQLGVPVVKAFNNIAASRLAELARPAGDPDRVALPVAGDDPAAKKRVMELVDELGFDAVDAGSIDDSWRQHMGTPSFLSNLQADQLREALQVATREHNLNSVYRKPA
jgi:8-hydroxy-5-deazaflavin:NADPH oxidoreductase